MLKKVLVIGGAGYVGSVLVPKLLKNNYKVTVYDLYTYSRSKELGADIYGDFVKDKNLIQIKGDIRDANKVAKTVKGQDAIIHLACLSNDPSVYGFKTEKEVTEDLALEPLTDYGLYKVFSEKAISDLVPLAQTTWVIIRPSTVCGYAPRQRLDLSVNILTNLAVNKGVITVFGGSQQRPNIHIEDVSDLYVKMLEYKDKEIAGKIFNAGNENLSILEIAKKVKKIVDEMYPGRTKVKIVVTSSSDDQRSYRVSWKKIKKELVWKPKHTIDDAVRDLVDAFKAGKLEKSLEDPIYFNIKWLQKIKFK